MVYDSNDNPSTATVRSDGSQAESSWTLNSLWHSPLDLPIRAAKVRQTASLLDHVSSSKRSQLVHDADMAFKGLVSRTLRPNNLVADPLRDDSSIDWDLSPADYAKEPSSVLSKASTLADLSKLKYHRHLADFGEQLENAAKATMITDRKSNYAKVTVLLLHWENEENDIVLKVDRLGRVLSRHYGFVVERWAIPVSNKSHREVTRKTGELVEDDNPLHLRIILYTGSSLNPNGELTWAPRGDFFRQSRPPVVRWSAIRDLLEEAPVDILILLDCCKPHVPNFEGGNGVTSLIVAGSFNTIALQESEFSFIEVLTRQLDALRNLPSFSTSFLYSRIYQDIQSRPNQKQSSSLELPVHLILTQDPAYPRDILLSSGWDRARFKLADTTNDNNEPEKCRSRCNSLSRKGPWHSEESSETTIGETIASPAEISNHPRLLLSFRLWEDMDPDALKVDLFSHWLGSLPIPVEAVKVEAVKVEAGFASDSTILLVSVPIGFLPFLPSDPSVTVIGTIHTGNLMPTYSAVPGCSNEDSTLTYTTGLLEADGKGTSMLNDLRNKSI